MAEHKSTTLVGLIERPRHTKPVTANYTNIIAPVALRARTDLWSHLKFAFITFGTLSSKNSTGIT